ncbi:hypothetical protein [Dactylosporangium sp. NPDC005555]|uniref:hypothetical protein n=1 Tax=Dactylosporangium sp. NPDC005555 TaxID=3154889 RepID=UPI0033AFA76D
MSDPAQRVGLVGYRVAGSAFHAPLICTTPGLRLSAIVTADPGRRCGLPRGTAGEAGRGAVGTQRRGGRGRRRLAEPDPAVQATEAHVQAFSPPPATTSSDSPNTGPTHVDDHGAVFNNFSAPCPTTHPKITNSIESVIDQR